VDNNVVLNEDLVAALQTHNLELEAANKALTKKKNDRTRLLKEVIETEKSLQSALNDYERKIDESQKTQAFLQATLDNRDRQLKESLNAQLSLRIALDNQIETMRQYEERICSLTDEVDKTQQKEHALRKIILDKAGSEKVSDQTMVSKFIGIRQKIQNIARLHHYHMDQPLLEKMEDPAVARFFEEEPWGWLTTGDRINRVRSMIFRIIRANFFNTPLFGLDVCVTEDTLAGQDVDVESGLRVFENLLKERKGKSRAPVSTLVTSSNTLSCTVSAGVISDWRVLTIECIDKLEHHSPWAHTVSVYIFDFFQPLLANQASPSDRNEVLGKIIELCDEAMDLGMLMRRSRDLYIVKFPGKDGVPLSASACGESLVQPIGVENGKGKEAGDEIAHTLFGALVKQPEHGDGRQMVLEVAHVILKKENKTAISTSIEQTGEAGQSAQP